MGMNSGKGVIHLGLSFIGCVIQTQSISTPGTETIISIKHQWLVFYAGKHNSTMLSTFSSSLNNARVHAWRIQARINRIVYIAIIDIRYPRMLYKLRYHTKFVLHENMTIVWLAYHETRVRLIPKAISCESLMCWRV